MKFYDVDGDGNIGYEEFIRGLRDELNPRKAAMVERAFRLMDKDGSGVITVSDIAKIYDVSENEDFKKGDKTAAMVL